MTATLQIPFGPLSQADIYIQCGNNCQALQPSIGYQKEHWIMFLIFSGRYNMNTWEKIPVCHNNQSSTLKGQPTLTGSF